MSGYDIRGFLSDRRREKIATYIENVEHAAVTEPHHVVTFGPVGSENRMAFAYRRVVDGRVEARIVAGCWNGTVTEFRKRVCDVYGGKGSTPNTTHGDMYLAFANAVRVREQQWQAEYEPPEPKAWIKNLHDDLHGYLDSAKTLQNPTGFVVRFRRVKGFDAEAEAEAWLARQLADDEPKRCSHVGSPGHQCRMNEGHATAPWPHYCVTDTEPYCDYDGCIRIPHEHNSHLRHLLADGTQITDNEPTDDEPTRCSFTSSSGVRCRMNEGHATDVWPHYCVSGDFGWCDYYDGCVLGHHGTVDHLLADGTEVPA